jgi:sodium/hydrogen exchanger 3
MASSLLGILMMLTQLIMSTGFESGEEGPTAVLTSTTKPNLDPLADLTESAQKILLVMVILAITLIANNFVEKAHLPVPEAIVTVAIGVVAGLIIKFTPLAEETITQYEDQSARQFMLFFIAPIIFAEGYGMKSRQFFENISRILSHAFIGTVISAFVVAAFVYYLPPATGYKTTIPFIQCMTFGVLISATDPVTTLAIFKSMNMVENGLSHLYFSVLGESILNDAVAITLFDGLSDVVRENKEVDFGVVMSIVGGFLVTFFGSMLIGIVCGLCAALILKFGMLGAHEPEEEHYHFNVPEIGVALTLAYLPFLIASSIDGQSGIVAVLFAGIVMRHFAHYNLTETSRNLFLPTIELMASVSECYVFLILGIGVFLQRNDGYSVNIILWASVGCLVGRFLNVYPISFVVNKTSRCEQLTANEFHVVWFAGLRGAIAFMCAMRFPMPEDGQNDFRDLFLCTTTIITLISMLLLGWPTGSVLRCLNIKAHEEPLLSVVDEDQARNPQAKKQSRLMNAIETERATSFSKSLKRIFMTQEAAEERASNMQRASEARLAMRQSLGAPSARDSRPPLGGGRSSNAIGDRPSADPSPGRPSNDGRPSGALSYGRTSSLRGLPRGSGPLEGRLSSSRSFRTLCNP